MSSAEDDMSRRPGIRLQADIDGEVIRVGELHLVREPFVRCKACKGIHRKDDLYGRPVLWLGIIGYYCGQCGYMVEMQRVCSIVGCRELAGTRKHAGLPVCNAHWDQIYERIIELIKVKK